MKNSFLIKNGTYGPAHDPYAFRDITFTNNDEQVIQLHQGMASKVTLPNGQIINEWDIPRHIITPEEIFAKFIGLDLSVINHLIEKQERRENEFPDPFGSAGMYV